MRFEVDSKILDLLKAKAERQGIELQQLLENFARSQPSEEVKSLGVILNNMKINDPGRFACARMTIYCHGVECTECPFYSPSKLGKTIKELKS